MQKIIACTTCMAPGLIEAFNQTHEALEPRIVTATGDLVDTYIDFTRHRSEVEASDPEAGQLAFIDQEAAEVNADAQNFVPKFALLSLEINDAIQKANEIDCANAIVGGRCPRAQAAASAILLFVRQMRM